MILRIERGNPDKLCFGLIDFENREAAIKYLRCFARSIDVMWPKGDGKIEVRVRLQTKPK